MSHSPEPWRVYNKAPQIVNADGDHFLDCRDISGHRETDADPEDIRRIVACVNFCKGVDTELLESSFKGNPEWLKQLMANPLLPLAGGPRRTIQINMGGDE